MEANAEIQLTRQHYHQLLHDLLLRDKQGHEDLIPEALFPPIIHTKVQRKNLRSLYRLKGKGLVLLKTNFSKKPKNPV